jgi:3,4-dihydroxyphenylacetate 2,3-dioxygenase
MTAINTHWVQPPFNILRAAHVELVVTDLPRARAFYVDALGFVVTEECADWLCLRGYEERLHHSLILRRGAQPLVGHLAFRVWSEDDLDRLAADLVARDRPVRWLNNAEPGQGRGLRTQDPLGFPIEYFHTMAAAERLLQKFDRQRGAQVMRLDHFNLHIPDVAAGYEHYRSLGFRCSEYTVADPPAEGLWGAWLYRKPSTHDVALTNGRGPRLHHAAFWLNDANAVLHTCDILAASGFGKSLERGPGRHGISNAFFLYLRDPDGHRLELFTGDYYTGDPDFAPIEWRLSDPQRATFWGAFAPPSWFGESSQVADLDGAPVPLREPLLADRPAVVKP